MSKYYSSSGFFGGIFAGENIFKIPGTIPNFIPKKDFLAGILLEILVGHIGLVAFYIIYYFIKERKNIGI